MPNIFPSSSDPKVLEYKTAFVVEIICVPKAYVMPDEEYSEIDLASIIVVRTCVVYAFDQLEADGFLYSVTPKIINKMDVEDLVEISRSFVNTL